jgi:hypothetical protein
MALNSVALNSVALTRTQFRDFGDDGSEFGGFADDGSEFGGFDDDGSDEDSQFRDFGDPALYYLNDPDFNDNQTIPHNRTEQFYLCRNGNYNNINGEISFDIYDYIALSQDFQPAQEKEKYGVKFIDTNFEKLSEIYEMWDRIDTNCKEALKEALKKALRKSKKKNLSETEKTFLEDSDNICGFFKLKIEGKVTPNHRLIVPQATSVMVLFNQDGNNITKLKVNFKKDCVEKNILSKWFKIKGSAIGVAVGDEVFGFVGKRKDKVKLPSLNTFKYNQRAKGTLTGKLSYSAGGGSRKRRRNKIKSNKKKSLPKKNRISKKKNSKNLRRRIRVNGKKSQRRI